jgi:hypothetical protein
LNIKESKAFDQKRICLTFDAKKDLYETLFNNNKLFDLIPDFFCFGDIVRTLQTSPEK